MIFVDTAYVLALLNRRDQLYQRAQKWALAVSGPLVVTEYVLCEIVNAFSMPADRPKAHAAVDDILTSADWDLVDASGALFHAGLQLHRSRNDKEWSLTDCISFVVMNQREIRRALTYDHHFEQAGFDALLRREPP